MKKLVAIVLSVLVGFCVPFCASAESEQDQIFAINDSYVAGEKGTNFRFGLALLFSNDLQEPFGNRMITTLSFGDDSIVKISDIAVVRDNTMNKYTAATINMTANFLEVGYIRTSVITITFETGEIMSYYIGNYCFEVFNDIGDDLLYTYSTPALSDNPYRYTYAFIKESEADISIAAIDIHTDADVVKIDIETDDFAGDVAFSEEQRVNYRLIRPKFTLYINNESATLYPKVGCYCGGLDMTEEQILEAHHDVAMDSLLTSNQYRSSLLMVDNLAS